MIRCSAWWRETVQRQSMGFLCIALMLLISVLAACGGASASQHARARATAASPAPKGWSTIPSPGVGQEGSLVGVTALSTTDGWAVGQYEGLDSLQRTLTERWNGTRWSYQPSPSPGREDNILQAVSGSSASDVWAVGSGGNDGLILHWDGKHWSTVTPPASAAHSYTELQSVAAHGANDVWAVGTAYNGDGTGGTHVAVLHWDGHTWSDVHVDSPGVVDNSLFGITSVSTGELWAVGAYADDCLGCGAQQALIEHYTP